VIVEVVGKYSLRDVSMRLVDAAEDDPRAAAGTSVDLGFIAARTFSQLLGSIFDSVRRSEEGRLDIFFSAFNGVMYQLLDFGRSADNGASHHACSPMGACINTLILTSGRSPTGRPKGCGFELI
jgi:hypothetical protein